MDFNLEAKNINYIKIIYKNSANYESIIKTSVRKIEGNEIFVFLKQEERLDIPFPQEVKLKIACNNGLYETTSILNSVLFKNLQVFLTLELLSEINYKQEREYFRVRLDGKAIVSYTEDDRLVDLECKIFDVSANGVSLIFPPQIQDFECLKEKIDLNLQFKYDDINVKARLVRFEKENNQFKASYYFYNIRENERNILSQICLQKQLEDKRAIQKKYL